MSQVIIVEDKLSKKRSFSLEQERRILKNDFSRKWENPFPFKLIFIIQKIIPLVLLPLFLLWSFLIVGFIFVFSVCLGLFRFLAALVKRH